MDAQVEAVLINWARFRAADIRSAGPSEQPVSSSWHRMTGSPPSSSGLLCEESGYRANVAIIQLSNDAPDCFKCLLLRYSEKMSIDDMAVAYSVDKRTVYRYLKQAKDDFWKVYQSIPETVINDD